MPDASPIKLSLPDPWRAPVIFASPHSGAHYPKALTAHSPLSLSELRQNEDAYVDALFAPVIRLGAPLLAAQFPRCFVDVNRAQDDLPPDWGGPDSADPAHKSPLGLGVVPIAISDRLSIYRRPPNRTEVVRRLARYYHPYHNALDALVRDALAGFGQSLLIDCHSMPGFAPAPARSRKGRTQLGHGARRPDIILGDCHGRAARPETMRLVERGFRERGYTVARNYPYAGGFVTEHHGRPELSREAVQIEINRDLYLNPLTLAPKSGFARLQRDLSAIAGEIISAFAPDRALAAE